MHARGAEAGRTPAQVPVRWSPQKGFNATPRSANPRHIATNADSVDFARDSAQMALPDALDERLTTDWDAATMGPEA